MATFVRKRTCKKKIVSSDEDEYSESENESCSESSNETSSCDDRNIPRPSRKSKSICQVTTRSSSRLKDKTASGNIKSKFTEGNASSTQGHTKRRGQKKCKVSVACEKKILSSDEDESSGNENGVSSESSDGMSSSDNRAIIQPSRKGSSSWVRTRSSSRLKDEKESPKNKITEGTAECSQGLTKKRGKEKLKKILSSDEDRSSGNESGVGSETSDGVSLSDDGAITQPTRKNESICQAMSRSSSRLEEKETKEDTKNKVVECSAESSQDLTKKRGSKKRRVFIAEEDSESSRSDIELQDAEMTPKKESNDDSEMKTPENYEHTTVSKGRRSSTRVRQKQNSRGSFKMPDRKKILDSIEDYCPEKEFVLKRRLSPKRLANNFLKERSSYNRDRFDTYLSEDDSDPDDFIADDDECIEYESEESEKHKPKKKIREKLVKRRKRKKFSSSSSNNESSDEKQMNRLPKKLSQVTESDSSSNSSNDGLNLPAKREKKNASVLKSDSEEETAVGMQGNVKCLPRRVNKEKEKMQKAADMLRRKRELAKSKLPLDRRRYLEQEIDEELSSEIEGQFDDPIQIFGVQDDVCVEEDNEFVVRDSDIEFITSSSGSENEESRVRTENEFRICLNSLRHSGGIQNDAFIKEEAHDSLVEEIKHESQLPKYKRVVLDYDSDDELGSDSAMQLFQSIRNKDNNIGYLRDLIRKNLGLLETRDCHGRGPLHIASISGNLEATKLLMEFGVNADIPDYMNLPSIVYAAYWKHPKILKILLQKTHLSIMHRLIHKNLTGMTLLHLIMLDFALVKSEDIEERQLECLHVVKECNSIMYSSMLDKADKKQRTPILTAISEGQLKCLEELLPNDKLLQEYSTEISGNVLHYAVIHSISCKEEDSAALLRLLLERFKNIIDEPDKNGFTPLMYAAENGNVDCLKALLDYGAAVKFQDNHGTSALHLAAAIGNTECVKLLLSHGHEVDILDDCGWPPLLYANFQSCESCVVELMKAKPKQLFVLSSLIADCDESQKEKNIQVVKNTILSLANQDAYYTIFNDFIRQNPSLLDEFNHGIFLKTWRAILDFENKHSWLKRRVTKLRKHFLDRSDLTVRRDDVLGSAMRCLVYNHTISINNLSVDFYNEPGMCTGPKKEFLVCLCNEIVKPTMKLFTQIDDQQYSPTPLTFFADILWDHYNSPAYTNSVQDNTPSESSWTSQDKTQCSADSGIETSNPATTQTSIQDKSPSKEANTQEASSPEKRSRIVTNQIKNELRKKLDAMKFIGRFIAACIAEGWYINLLLSKPFIKQILGLPLNHPADLQSVDNGLYNGVVTWVLENSIDEYEMPFSINCKNPWDGSRLEEVQLTKFNGLVTDKNKEEFVELVSKFKLCESTAKEVEAFKRGFHLELKQELISVFTPDEFSLLMNGVQNIDVHDWKQNTIYNGWHKDDTTIAWFWNTVKSLKQDEKALLLKFSTGSPCVPIGGFKNLTGLGGTRRFTISKRGGQSNSIPTAATCFNMIQLGDYDNEKELREKVLIALRHGCEGFSWS